MTSLISNYKAIWITLGCATLIELLLWLPLPADYTPYSQSLFSYRYLRQEKGVLSVIAWKMVHYLGRPAEFVQAGDSTGYFGVNPTILRRYLPDHQYINTNCCAILGFPSYRHVAEAFLRENKEARYTVLTLGYASLPMRYKDKTYKSLRDAALSPWRWLQWLPSLQYRSLVTNVFYYQYKGSNVPGLNFDPTTINYNLQDNGFRPILKNLVHKPVNTGECHFDYLYDAEGRATLAPELEKFKAVADKYNTKMILILSPVPCTPGPRMEPILDNIRLFLKNHPDVISPLPLVRQYPAAFFRDDEGHMEVEGAIRNSHEIGKALAHVLGLHPADSSNDTEAALPESQP